MPGPGVWWAGWGRCRKYGLRVHPAKWVRALWPGVDCDICHQRPERPSCPTVRTIFGQPIAEAAHAQLDTVADMLGRQSPKVPAMLLSQDRPHVVQIFPNPDALERLTTAVLTEMHDEWIAFPRRYLPEGSMDKIYPAEDRPNAVTPLRGT